MVKRLQRYLLLCAVLANSLGGGGIIFANAAFTTCPPDTTGTYPNCVYEAVAAFTSGNADYYDPTPPYIADLRTFWAANEFPTEYCAGAGNFHVYNPAITCQYYAICDGRYLVRHVNNACSAWINAYLLPALWDRGTGLNEEPEPDPEPTYEVQGSTVSIVYISTTVLAQMNPGPWKDFTGGDISFFFGLFVGSVVIMGFKAGGLS